LEDDGGGGGWRWRKTASVEDGGGDIKKIGGGGAKSVIEIDPLHEFWFHAGRGGQHDPAATLARFRGAVCGEKEWVQKAFSKKPT
jgi:hypothetical protein